MKNINSEANAILGVQIIQPYVNTIQFHRLNIIFTIGCNINGIEKNVDAKSTKLT